MQNLRQQEILKLLQKTHGVTVSALAARFNKTPITIRRDLSAMEKLGLLQRTHGGAVPTDTPNFDLSPYEVREREHPREKSAIAACAVQFIHEGDCILMNAGTSLYAVARELRGFKDLQVVTNGLTVAAELSRNPGIDVLLLGGTVDPKKLGTVGPVAETAVKELHVSHAFLGVSGISVADGIAMHNQAEATINAAFLATADEVTVLVDASKFSNHSLYRIASLDRVNRVISDERLPQKVRRALDEANIEVLIASDED